MDILFSRKRRKLAASLLRWGFGFRDWGFTSGNWSTGTAVMVLEKSTFWSGACSAPLLSTYHFSSTFMSPNSTLLLILLSTVNFALANSHSVINFSFYCQLYSPDNFTAVNFSLISPKWTLVRGRHRKFLGRPPPCVRRALPKGLGFWGIGF